jgi:hypothetical protein
VDLKSLKPGQEVTEGFVYRRIPNTETDFDYDEMLPEPSTFVPRIRDRGAISGHLDEAEAMAQLADPRHAGFGLAAFDIDTLRRESAGKARVVFDPGRRSRSHVRIYGCDDDNVRLLLATIAEMIREPGKPRQLP